MAIDDERASAKSRVVALRLTLMTLRLMENWQRHFRDPETAVLSLAIAAINGEKLLREDLEHDRQDLRNPMPVDRLTRCNLNSIAVATGINRETARRKVNALADGHRGSQRRRIGQLAVRFVATAGADSACPHAAGDAEPRFERTGP